MSVSLKLLAVATAATAGVLLAVGCGARSHDPTELVTVAPGTFTFRLPGEFLNEGTPVNAPAIAVTFELPLFIMKRQVSEGEYQACVRGGACKVASAASGRSDLPVVGVSFHDATAYAAWLSRRTGEHYRLPTDSEWAYAAASRFHDDALAEDGDAANPAKRWLQSYETEATAAAVEAAPRPFGGFGTNENGLEDLAGNVWEWTATCFTRHTTRSAGNTVLESCGVRVVEGSHRTYLSDFVRNARGGACSTGAPPANLGIRLVREGGTMLDRLVAGLRRIGTGT